MLGVQAVGTDLRRIAAGGQGAGQGLGGAGVAEAGLIVQGHGCLLAVQPGSARWPSGLFFVGAARGKRPWKKRVRAILRKIARYDYGNAKIVAINFVNNGAPWRNCATSISTCW
ncbi:Uncharacterised protein [Bordetella pertussis]|nr:Uncharacterised protein [Bordetella pertussis]